MNQSLYRVLRTIGLLPLLILACGSPKNIEKHITVADPAFESKLTHLLEFDVPLISVDQLKHASTKYHIIDTRAQNEFQIAHITQAQFLDFKHFNLDDWKHLRKDEPLVFYCSVGYRSEKIARKFKSAGYQHVYNLYGGIFEWANRDYPLANMEGDPVHELHTYNRKWAKWMKNASIKPVY